MRLPLQSFLGSPELLFDQYPVTNPNQPLHLIVKGLLRTCADNVTPTHIMGEALCLPDRPEWLTSRNTYLLPNDLELLEHWDAEPNQLLETVRQRTQPQPIGNTDPPQTWPYLSPAKLSADWRVSEMLILGLMHQDGWVVRTEKHWNLSAVRPARIDPTDLARAMTRYSQDTRTVAASMGLTHAELKAWLLGPGAEVELPVDTSKRAGKHQAALARRQARHTHWIEHITQWVEAERQARRQPTIGRYGREHGLSYTASLYRVQSTGLESLFAEQVLPDVQVILDSGLECDRKSTRWWCGRMIGDDYSTQDINRVKEALRGAGLVPVSERGRSVWTRPGNLSQLEAEKVVAGLKPFAKL